MPAFASRAFFLAFLALSATPLAAQTPDTTDPKAVRPGTYALDAGHTRVVWSLSHRGFSTYSGLLPAASGTLVLDPEKPEASRVEVTLNSADVATADPRFDPRLKGPDYFNAAAFPTLTFASSAVKVEGSRAQVTGTLTLLGQSRPVTLDVTFHKAGINPTDKLYHVGFDATGTLTRSDFGLKTGLPGIGDAVKLQIEAEFTQKE
ncbi:polyisoprenoid-binding protein YceI [Azorhizobium sp. AG788]|uniref:YceI family protein n=1 Tax=Azorhizobium sp. AG788 TaxID=2183897 RepID=UPI00105FF92E|nr:YceI family protein [Azorhizobium sp. AG788]TDT91291.1 polyisoprenoid-binding protein YceI [Azorhizobium sp. AG788]